MVYMTPEDLGWRPYVKSWIPRVYEDESILSQELKDRLYALFDTTVDFAFDKIKNASLVEYVKTVEI